jgi:hypothetical protein
MPLIFSFLLRVLLVVAGLTVAAAMLVVFVFVLGAWSLRALWARVTGRPVAAFGMRMGPAAAFHDIMRRAPAAQASRTPRADAVVGPRRGSDDVTDVQPRPPG